MATNYDHHHPLSCGAGPLSLEKEPIEDPAVTKAKWDDIDFIRSKWHILGLDEIFEDHRNALPQYLGFNEKGPVVATSEHNRNDIITPLYTRWDYRLIRRLRNCASVPEQTAHTQTDAIIKVWKTRTDEAIQQRRPYILGLVWEDADRAWISLKAMAELEKKVMAPKKVTVQKKATAEKKVVAEQFKGQDEPNRTDSDGLGPRRRLARAASAEPKNYKMKSTRQVRKAPISTQSTQPQKRSNTQAFDEPSHVEPQKQRRKVNDTFAASIPEAPESSIVATSRISKRPHSAALVPVLEEGEDTSDQISQRYPLPYNPASPPRLLENVEHRADERFEEWNTTQVNPDDFYNAAEQINSRNKGKGPQVESSRENDIREDDAVSEVIERAGTLAIKDSDLMDITDEDYLEHPLSPFLREQTDTDYQALTGKELIFAQQAQAHAAHAKNMRLLVLRRMHEQRKRQ